MKKNVTSFILLFMLCFTLTGLSITADAADYRIPEEITGMDLDGNVYVIEDSDGSFENEVSPYSRAGNISVVNFNTKGMSAVTEYKEDKTGIDGYTCGGYGADAAFLGYVGDNSEQVKFMLSGVVGVVKASEVQVVSLDDAKSVSCYMVKDGRLVHYITTNMTTEGHGSSLDQGPAPSYLKAGTTYYSYDGHYFYTDYSVMLNDYVSETRSSAVNSNNPYFNYFQFLPLRSQTLYTSDELTSMINDQSGTESGMYNLGSSFISNQNKYGVNAIIATGIAANESAWGKSKIAKQKNNLFGLNAVDSSPGESANYYPSTDACVKEFTQYHMSKGYLFPKDWRYFSGALGNKASGINVKYASDPYWGEKAANVAWLFSKKYSPKDVNVYSLGIKNLQSHQHSEVNVRDKATTSGSSVLFTTPKAAAYPVIILGEENGFYKIQCDGIINSDRTAVEKAEGEYNYSAMYAYISADYVTKVLSGSSVVPPQPDVPDVPDNQQPELKEGWNQVDGSWYYVENGVKITNSWKKINDSWFYFEEDGSAATGFEFINGYWYYFDSNCYMLTGWQVIDGEWYYFNSDGSAATGWKKFNENWCYLEEKGHALTGLQKISGKYYYFNDSCYMETGWQVIDGEWYYFNTDGSAATGWVKFDANWCYFDENAVALRGLHKIGEDYFYFSSSCYMQTGWQKLEGYWYYFTTSGNGAKGLTNISDKLYYFDNECRMQTGWQEVDGKSYYFNEDGSAVSGFQDIDGKFYYFDENYVMYKGWLEIGEDKYYFDEDGAAVGLKYIDGKLYYFNENHFMQKGVRTVDGRKYYFGNDGAAVSGWKKIDNKWYYFADDYAAATGWYKIDDSWYFFNSDCHMQTGWQYVNGYWFYLTESGAAATGWMEIGGKWYYFDSNCYMQVGWNYINGHWFYFRESGAAEQGWLLLDGKWYYFDEYCYMQLGWCWIGGNCYYFYDSGEMATDTWIDGCYVNSSGVWVK